jgi:hypothetical protein
VYISTPNTGRPSTKLVGFATTKNPSPLIAMNVPVEAFWISPWTSLVGRELATTVPAVCLPGVALWIMSAKLVSSRL